MRPSRQRGWVPLAAFAMCGVRQALARQEWVMAGDVGTKRVDVKYVHDGATVTLNMRHHTSLNMRTVSHMASAREG